MKKYLLIALAVMVFATPVMAQPTLSGTFRLGAFWDVQDQNYASRLDRARLVLRSNIDEFNAVRFEMRADRPRQSGDGTIAGRSSSRMGSFGDHGEGNEVLMRLNQATVTTNWAKYFEFEDAVGLTTTIGYGAFGTFDRLGFTIWGIGGQAWATAQDFGGRIDFNIANGIVRPYAATAFAAYSGSASFLLGAGIDLSSVIDAADIWLEAFFLNDGATFDDGTPVGKRGIGAELLVGVPINDDMKVSVGGVLDIRNGAFNTRNVPHADTASLSTGDSLLMGGKGDLETLFKAFLGFDAFGANLGLAFLGGVNDKDMGWFPMGLLAVSANYDITKFLAIQAGGKFAFADYAKEVAGDESWLGAQFGVVVRPGRVRYDIAYLVLNDKAQGMYFTDTWGLGNSGQPNGITSPSRAGDSKGGIMFAAAASF